MSPTFLRRFALAWRVVLALLALAVAVVVAGHDEKTIHIDDSVAFWSAVALACVVFLDNAFGGVRAFRAVGRSKAESRVQKALTALLVQIAAGGQVQIQDLGASVFVPRRRWQRWWFRRTLVRVLRFRLDDHPQPTKVTWTKGKGAVGKCWETGRRIHRDWHTQRSDHSQPDLAPEEFGQIEEQLRDGFEHREFVSIAEKYSEVLAAPVLSVAGETVGVISIDVAGRAGIQQCLLDGDDVSAMLDVAATLIRDDLDRLYAQS